jgi:all-trans-retinol dehydrogenase (NAD+)
MTKFFLEQMKENQGGHLVCIASMSGMFATPFSVPYAATKFAINGFMSALTEHLRLEKWRSKIKTTCVFPYYVRTREDVEDFLHPE